MGETGAGELLEEAIACWNTCPAELPEIGPVYTAEEQREREAELDRCLSAVEGAMRQAPLTPGARREMHARVSAALMEFARRALGMDEAQMGLLFESGFSQVGSELAREARAFDAAVSMADILQACRNAWAACGLQALFGLEMRVTPGIFGYSMLYPYSDNYLDDARVSSEQKLAFSGRFRGRLAGLPVEACGALDRTIFELIGRIESEYPRAEFGEVWEALLAIHAAQQQSIFLLRAAGLPVEAVERTVFAKGGASVLADAALAAGSLTDAEAAFAFGWGVVLQLGDDLQDVREDAAAGISTLFTRGAKGRLDEATARTLQFAMRTFDGLAGFTRGPKALRELLASSSVSLIVRAAGAAGDLHSRGFMEALERYSPFGFEFLARRAARLDGHKKSLGRVFELFLSGDGDEAAFPLFPSALLPYTKAQ